MSDVFADPTVRAAVGVVVLCILIAGGFYLLSSFRDYTAQDREADFDVRSNLREMRRKGDISDEEFRTIESSADRQSGRNRSSDESASQADDPGDP